jgi:hypothetical protein
MENPRGSEGAPPKTVELPKTPEDLARYTADIQIRTIRSISDILGNTIQAPIGNQQLRDMDITEDVPTASEDLDTMIGRLEPTKRMLDRIVNLLAKEKKPLPEIDEGSGPMVDLKYRTYEKLEDLTPREGDV